MQIEVSLKHPFSMLVSGGRGVGKTVFTKNVLKYRNEMIYPVIDRIVWCYAKHQPKLFYELKDLMPAIEYVQGIPENLDEYFDRNSKNLIILDDLMDESGDDKRVSQLFSRGRHDNLSVIYLTQNLFHSKQRSISLNSDYMIIFKNARDKLQFSTLAKQVMPMKSKFLNWAYDDATKEPHTYLMLNLRADTNEKHRIRTNILPNEEPQYVYIP